MACAEACAPTRVNSADKRIRVFEFDEVDGVMTAGAVDVDNNVEDSVNQLCPPVLFFVQLLWPLERMDLADCCCLAQKSRYRCPVNSVPVCVEGCRMCWPFAKKGQDRNIDAEVENDRCWTCPQLLDCSWATDLAYHNNYCCRQVNSVASLWLRRGFRQAGLR